MIRLLRWTAVSGGIFLLVAGQSAFPQILGTKHDLAQRANTTEEVCVFCHTPHGAAANSTAPLWNKVLAPGGSYLPSTGTFGTAVTPGSVTVACLSCHDGVQATDVVINAPGSGGYNPAGTSLDPGRFDPLTGNDVICTPGTPCDGHHPISVQYGGGGVSETTQPNDGLFSGSLGLPNDFNAPMRLTTSNGLPVWWVDSAPGTTGIKEKTDMILFTRDDLGPLQPFVECASCHDPHTDAVNRFLRNDGDICATCHVI